MPTLREIYENPRTSTRNAELLARRAGTTIKSAKAFLATQMSAAVRTAWRRPSAEQFAPAGAPAGHWQADVMYLGDYKGVNDKRTAVVTLMNTTTRYAIVRPLLNAKAATVAAALEDVFETEHPKIEILRVDGGPEWNATSKKFLEGRGVALEVGEPNTHTWLSRTDRLHRTLRERLGEYFEREDTNRWIDVLPSIIANYNESPHRTLSELLGRKASPASITAKEEGIIRAHERERAAAVGRATDAAGIIPGKTYVRVLRQKTREGSKSGAFVKGQVSAWSRESFPVLERNGVNSFLVDTPPGEVKIWPLHSLRVAQREENKSSPPAPNRVDIKVVRAKKLEARNISEDEQAAAIKAPARSKREVKPKKVFTPAAW
jgi:hypothetical protein